VRESKIESKVCEHAAKLGWKNRKFNSKTSDPDRMFWRKRELKLGFVYPEVLFIEFKQLREKPEPGQVRRHAELRGDGFSVYVIDNVEEGYKVFDDLA